MRKKWLIIIVIIILIISVGSYFLYKNYMNYAIAECYKHISDCKLDERMGMLIECPLCCDKNGKELYDGNRLNECIERN